jgi:hypothetical protein
MEIIMLVNEIWIDTFIKKDNDYFNTLKNRWNYAIMKGNKLINLGKIDNYNVQYLKQDKQQYSAISFNGQPIAIVELIKVGKGRNI